MNKRKKRCENNQQMNNPMFVKPYPAALAACRCATNRTGILPLQPARTCTTTARPQQTSSTPDFYPNNSCCNEGVIAKFFKLNCMGGGKMC
jgi:hypothetical protein